MEQLPPPISDASHNYATHNYFDKDQIITSKISFEAGSDWQKEQVLDVLLLAAHFIMNATPQNFITLNSYNVKFN